MIETQSFPIDPNPVFPFNSLRKALTISHNSGELTCVEKNRRGRTSLNSLRPKTRLPAAGSSPTPTLDRAYRPRAYHLCLAVLAFLCLAASAARADGTLEDTKRLETEAASWFVPCTDDRKSQAAVCEQDHKDFVDALLLAHLGQPYFMGLLLDFYNSNTTFAGFNHGKHYVRPDKTEACAWAYIRSQMKSSDYISVFKETWFAGCVLNDSNQAAYRDRAKDILRAGGPQITSHLFQVTIKGQQEEGMRAVAEKLVVEYYLSKAR
jgi:hypothetical protein